MIPANDVAEVILARRSEPWTDAWTLQKLLYYVQAWHLAITDTALFPEKIKGWRHGPVVPEVRHARQSQSTRRAASQNPDRVQLDDLASGIIDLVIAAYGSMSGEELSALTHVEEPWLESRVGLGDSDSGSVPLNLETMASFYRTHRRLGGRRASDLAAGGVYVLDSRHRGESLDMDAVLASVPEIDGGIAESPWPSSNLATNVFASGRAPRPSSL